MEEIDFSKTFFITKQNYIDFYNRQMEREFKSLWPNEKFKSKTFEELIKLFPLK